MATVYTFSGFSFFETGGPGFASTLEVVGSDNLRLTFSPAPPDGDSLLPLGEFDATTGSIASVSLNGNVLDEDDDVEVGMATVSIGGQSAQFLAFYNEGFGLVSAFQIAGPSLTAGPLPTAAEVQNILQNAVFGPITSGPFAFGTEFDPSLAISVTETTFVFPQPPIGTGITEFDDPAIASALFAGQGFALQSLEFNGAPQAIALLETGWSISPIAGGAPVVGIDRGVFLTTGGGPGTSNTSSSFSVSLGTPGDPLLDQAAQAAFSGSGDTLDAATIAFTFNATALGDAPSISFDLFFGSEEFPEFVDSIFVDIAAVFVNGVNYALFNNDPTQPLAIVGASINTPGNFFTNGLTDGFDDLPPNTVAYNTEYDGFSVLLNVIAPVQQGLNTVVIGIADTGDRIYDSGLFIGNVQASNIAVSGSFVINTGTPGADLITTNAAPELITLNGGADTVAGAAPDLNGDVITDWTDEATIEVLGALFGVDDVTITLGSAILDIDTTGDGASDTTITLQGDFSEAEFSFNTVDGNTQINTTGASAAGGAVLLTGTDGADTLVGGAGNDTIRGLGGDDVISGQAGDDSLEGGAGNDQIAGGDGNDTIFGGDGNDNIGGGLGDDLIHGDAGNDTIGGGQGNDTIYGGDGDDVLAGGVGNDEIYGGTGSDTIGGSLGADTIEGGAGADSLGGGTGRDLLYGGGGNDSIGGGEGDDTVYGGAGNDFLAGGGRNDLIFGGDGNDIINGGTGNDTMTGGAGADLFVFNSLVAGEADVITDFETGSDMIRLRGVAGQGIAGKFDALDITSVGGNAVIAYDGHTITLQGVAVASLDAGDFLFI